MMNYVAALLSIVFLAGASYFVRLAPQPQAAPPQQATFSSPRAAWAVALLQRLGNGDPTKETVAMVVEWTLAEDGSGGAMARNNPLNTTACGHNMTGAINTDGACGVGGYATPEDGIGATVDTLEQSNFAEIRAALIANDAEGAKRALWASPWAESHYGWGANWPQAEETQRVSLPKCLPTSTGNISAHFNDTSSPYWSAQAGGRHNGTDFSGAQGDPVFAPFGFTVEDVQYYGDAARIGWYVQGRFADGYLFYAGHLGTVAVQIGERVAACSVIGTIGEVFHTHIKINRPGSPEPCEATGCDDFELYYQEH